MPIRSSSTERALQVAFTASLKSSVTSTGGAGKPTITRADAQQALQQLGGAADPVPIVQGFLDGSDAQALSSKARQLLTEFVKGSQTARTGESALQVKLQVKIAVHQETAQAELGIKKARGRLEALIAGAGNKEVVGGLTHVRAWLDAAAADVDKARATLKSLAGAAADASKRDLAAAQKDLGKATIDVDALLKKARTTKVTRADLEQLRTWLDAPLPDLENAAGALMLGPPQGGGPHMQPQSLRPGDVLSLKYPSDAEDHGIDHGHGGGGIHHTMKYPSDNEDGGGTPVDLKPKVSSSHAAGIKKAAQRAIQKTGTRWTAGTVERQHRGERFAKLELARDGKADGWRYTAYIPLGALAPGVVPADPSSVSTFYLERTGGKRGATETTGPLAVL